MKHKIYLALTLLVLSIGLGANASAQKRGTLYKGVNWKKAVEAARNGETKINKESLARVEAAYSERGETASYLPSQDLTGTWYVTVAGPTPAENFYAYQTFGYDGTFVETSSLLVTLTEGPAHGVWEARTRGYVLTFELFAFDPEDGVQVGRVRVRNVITMNGRDNFAADSAVDFIEPDGTIVPNIAAGPFSGTRVQVLGL